MISTGGSHVPSCRRFCSCPHDFDANSVQLEEFREYAADHYPGDEVKEYVDLVSGTVEGGSDQYRTFRDAIADGDVGRVVVHELSRLPC